MNGAAASGPDLIVLHEADTCATALRDLGAGLPARVQGSVGEWSPLVLRDQIALGHKAALVPIAAGDLVLKHGEPFGRATAAIAPGAHIHVHNVASLSLETDVDGGMSS